MTRLLSDLLGAPQPAFGQRLKQLERASGEPGADIRLSVDILARSQAKLLELGLDPKDTTGPELYAALVQRLLDDERRLREHLSLASDAPSSEVLSRVLQFETKLDLPRSCFALKASVAKRLLKKLPPKKAMSQLGYRSVDSMIKHEPVAQIYTVATLYESSSWRSSFVQLYDNLQPSDFESRSVGVLFPRAKRWEKVAAKFADQHKHNSIVFKELGVVVVLPVKAEVPALGLTSLLLLLDGLNTIRCSSSYLKLQQVGMGFGTAIRQVASGEPATNAMFAGQPLPWRLVQYYYHMVRGAYHPALFEPHVQPEDLSLAEAEKALAEAIPSLAFWEDTAGLAHASHGQVVSLNMQDVALSVANNLDFEQRIVKHVQEHVWGDIIIRYLQHRNLELAEQLSDQSADTVVRQGALV